MRILVLDNYDSFTYNLVYIVRQNNVDVDVYRNDKITPEECLSYDGIILSPGPGVPNQAGNMPAIIEACAGRVPILGVCLGHQAIAEYLGGSLRMLEKVYHGVQDEIIQADVRSKIFNSLSSTFLAGRYHSWDVSLATNVPYEVTAISKEGSVMALEYAEKYLYGIQFHPESILTPEGDKIIESFLDICKEVNL